MYIRTSHLYSAYTYGSRTISVVITCFNVLFCTVGVVSTSWSLTAAATQAPPPSATSMANPAQPTPPPTLPSTSQESQPQRQVQPPQHQRQKGSQQDSGKREVVEQPKVAKQETPPPVESAPSQWPSFKDVWDSSSRWESHAGILEHHAIFGRV